MLTKVLAVVFAVAVPAVGGFVYMHNGGCPFSCSKSAECILVEPSAAETPSCCESMTRTSCLGLDAPPCCSDEVSAADVEVLTVQPRELK